MKLPKTFAAALAASIVAVAMPALAQSAPGVTDKEIKFGNTMPYSGPASGYSAQGRVQSA